MKKIRLTDRSLLIVFAVLFLIIMYLFALNNRYRFDGALIYDKWFSSCETIEDWA